MYKRFGLYYLVLIALLIICQLVFDDPVLNFGVIVGFGFVVFYKERKAYRNIYETHPELKDLQLLKESLTKKEFHIERLTNEKFAWLVRAGMAEGWITASPEMVEVIKQEFLTYSGPDFWRQHNKSEE